MGWGWGGTQRSVFHTCPVMMTCTFYLYSWNLTLVRAGSLEPKAWLWRGWRLLTGRVALMVIGDSPLMAPGAPVMCLSLLSAVADNVWLQMSVAMLWESFWESDSKLCIADVNQLWKATNYHVTTTHPLITEQWRFLSTHETQGGMLTFMSGQSRTGCVSLVIWPALGLCRHCVQLQSNLSRCPNPVVC